MNASGNIAGQKIIIPGNSGAIETEYVYNDDNLKTEEIWHNPDGRVEKAVSDNEYIIHLAAETGTGQSMYQINRYNEVNIMGTSNLLQAISNQGKDSSVKKIILSSSRSVYGEGKYNCPNCGIIYPKARDKERMLKGDFNLYCPHCNAKLELVATTEDSQINPCSLYAYTKYAQENMLQTMCPAMNIDYTIFRFQNNILW